MAAGKKYKKLRYRKKKREEKKEKITSKTGLKRLKIPPF